MNLNKYSPASSEVNLILNKSFASSTKLLLERTNLMVPLVGSISFDSIVIPFNASISIFLIFLY